MTENNNGLADFPNSTPAPETGYALGSDEAVQDVMQRLEAKRAERGDAPAMTVEQAEYIQRLANSHNAHAAKREAERSASRQQIQDWADKTNGAGNIHEARMLADAPDPTAQSDFHAESFAEEIGLDHAAVGQLQLGTADDALSHTREALGRLMDSVTDAELLAAVQENTAEAQRFRAAAERALDALADSTYGFSNEADETQKRNREIAVLNSLRLHLAHSKAGAAPPPLKQLLSRARLATDPGYSPGKRGVKRDVISPVSSARNIHSLYASNPF